MEDAHFGRCEWFLVYNTETMSHNFLKNPDSESESEESAGPAVVKFIAARGVQKNVSASSV